MSFFFAADPNDKPRGGRRHLTFATLHRLECKACPLDKLEGLLHPKMKPTGTKSPLIYFLGEAPGREEDEKGIQFVGKSGRLLRHLIPEEFEDKLRWNNCVRTRPPGNETPGVTELECCRPSIVRDVEATKPRAIFGFGGVPLWWATGEDGITKWRGRYFPSKIGGHTCWFFPMLHPAGLLRKRKTNRHTGRMIKSEEELAFERDLRRAFKLVVELPPAVVDRPVVVDGEFEGVSYVTGKGGWVDVERVKTVLRGLMDEVVTAIDIETASDETIDERKTRPYGKGARILSAAIAGEGGSFAFPLRHRGAGWQPKQLEAVEAALETYLTKAKGVKAAHNLSFELEWLGFKYGHKVLFSGRWGDTMAQAYVLDERKGMLSLGTLTLINFGFNLKGVSSVNRKQLDQEPLEPVLVYNALDSLYERKLYLKQKEALARDGLTSVYEDLHLPRIATATFTQLLGNEIDFERVLKLDKRFSQELSKTWGWLVKSEEAQLFKSERGKAFNPGSSKDVIGLYRDILKQSEGNIEVAPGVFKYTVDDAVLERIGKDDLSGFARKLQLFRAVSGNKAKYIDPLHPKTGKCIFPDNKVHPNLHTLFTDTGRTSASFPNEQFWPKRDEGYRELRAVFKAPSEDHYLVAVDQGQIEARVIEMAAEDQRYGKYLWDRHDIHGEWTERIAHAYPARIGGRKFIKDKATMKKFRTDVKNQWTFPLFFGANLWSVSEYLTVPVNTLEPLVNQFWDEYKGVREWQARLKQFYRENGYVECLTGRRRRAPIQPTELINSPIQGTASDITVDAWTRLSNAAVETEQLQFQARMEIHDELVFAVPKKTFDRDVQFIADYLLECRHFPFINVPLCIEVSRGPNWHEQESVMTLFSDDFGKIDRKECGF